MKTRSHRWGMKLFILLTYVAMLVINTLAELLPIGGVTTGEVSAAYPNLFAPAPYTFAIWGLIYLLLGLHTLYQLGFFQKDQKKVNTQLLDRVGLLFTLSSLLNIAWIFAWHYEKIGLSVILMLLLLLCLILIMREISKETLSFKERFFIKLPFAVYFGWITVATVANITTFLVSIGWDGFGISEEVWTIIVLLITLAIGVITMLRFRSLSYGLVLIWAYGGILAKHLSTSGFAGQYPMVILTTLFCLAVLTGMLIYLPLKRAKAARK